MKALKYLYKFPDSLFHTFNILTWVYFIGVRNILLNLSIFLKVVCVSVCVCLNTHIFQDSSAIKKTSLKTLAHTLLTYTPMHTRHTHLRTDLYLTSLKQYRLLVFYCCLNVYHDSQLYG